MNTNLLKILEKNPKSTFAFWDAKDEEHPKDASGMNWKKTKKLNEYKANIIFVGLNMADSSTIQVPFGNFHSSLTKHNDYKLRDALVGTDFEGSYMTDLFSFRGNSTDLRKYIKEYPDEAEKDIKLFIEECRLLTTEIKTVICIGSSQDHCKLLKKYYKQHKNELSDFRMVYSSTGEVYSIPHHSPMNNAHFPGNKYLTEVSKALKVISSDLQNQQ